MAAKNVILKAKIENQIVELMVKTGAENVYVDENTTLAAKIAELVADIDTKVTSSDVDTKVKAAIDDLIDGAPATYDTLKEISDYLGTHGNEYTALVQELATKVTAEQGKGLSTNDYTNEDKTKVAGIEAGAQVNKIEEVKVNGVAVTIDANKGVDIPVPTGALASKNTVAETDLDQALATKVNNADTKAHEHANATVLDGIDATVVEGWNAKARVIAATSQPADLAEGDLFIHIVG